MTIWWTALYPIISYCLPKDKRANFNQFNLSFSLINIHILNLPIAVIEFLWSNNRFRFVDLWMGIGIAYIYVLFYLFILDVRGVHLYIILSPRTIYCSISYIIIMLLYYIVYITWNHALLLIDRIKLIIL